MADQPSVSAICLAVLLSAATTLTVRFSAFGFAGLRLAGFAESVFERYDVGCHFLSLSEIRPSRTESAALGRSMAPV